MSQQFSARPAVAPLQSSSAQISAYSSSSSLASPSPQSAAPLTSPTMPSSQQQQFFGSMNQSQQQHSQQHSQLQPQQQEPHPNQLQRHPSYEYQPNRQGAGATQNETAAFLNSAALLAEAAKRASIQCVMRDIEEMEL